MSTASFNYVRASSVDEALTLLGQHDEAKFIAGGHSLLPAMKLRLSTPETLIDIGRIDELKGITPLRDGGFRIGALTTHAMVAAAGELPDGLTEAAAQIGDPQVRNVGTVGGNVAHADPASDLPTVLVALRATLEIQGPNGPRELAADEFFIDLFTTDLGADEILVAVRIPRQPAGSGSAYAKMVNPASRYAMVGAAAVLEMRGDTCHAASVAVGGLTPTARRARAVQAALTGNALTDDAITAAAAAVDADLGDDVEGDIHASADYRRAMAPVFVKRALMSARDRAG